MPDRAAYPDYFELIKSPISLAEIKKRVQTGECSSWAAFERDVKLMFTNARQYNVQGSLVCLDALKLEEEFKKRVAKAQAAARKRKSEDGRQPKPGPKSPRVAKPADPKKEMLAAWEAISWLQEPGSTRYYSTMFEELPDRAAYPDYFELIRSPISLAEIKKRVQTGECSSWAAFEWDVKLMFSNARQYNIEGSLVCLDALKLEEEFKRHAAKAGRKAAAAAQQPQPRKRKASAGKQDGSAKRMKAGRQDLGGQMLAAWEAMRTARNERGRELVNMFMTLPEQELYGDYYAVINRPVCMFDIRKRVQMGGYPAWRDFEADVRLLFANARQYNMEGSLVCLDAAMLERAYDAHVAAM